MTTPNTSHRRSWIQPAVAGAIVVIVMTTAAPALAAATLVVGQPLHDPPPATAQALIGQPYPLASSETAQVELTAVPETVQSPWLDQLAGKITANAADRDTDQCVRVDGVYGDSGGLRVQRRTVVLHPDTSAEVTTWRPATISYQQFPAIIVGEIAFGRGTPVREHAQPGELSVQVPLPVTAESLMKSILSGYQPLPPHTQNSALAIDVFDSITGIWREQAPPLPTRAAMLRLIARLPGTTIDPQAQDPLLRLTISTSMVTGSGEERTAYFDSSSGDLLAFTEIVRGGGYAPHGATAPWTRQISLFTTGCSHPTPPHRTATGDRRATLRTAANSTV